MSQLLKCFNVLIYHSQLLPSERDSPEVLRQKMGSMAGGGASNYGDVPIPTSTATKFGGGQTSVRNPFGGGQEDDPNYW